MSVGKENIVCKECQEKEDKSTFVYLLRKDLPALVISVCFILLVGWGYSYSGMGINFILGSTVLAIAGLFLYISHHEESRIVAFIGLYLGYKSIRAIFGMI